MDYQLIGDAMQTLLINLSPGESVCAETGAMLFCNDAIRYDARTPGLDGGVVPAVSGGAFASNAIGGSTIALTRYECLTPGGAVAFAAPFSGKIHALEVTGDAWLCQRNSLLCATSGVTAEIALARKFGTGLFASEGYVLWKLSGQGTVWLHLGGNMVETDLTAGRTMRLEAGCLAACKATVNIDLQFDGGYKNALFGGEGSFQAVLSGAGKALIQTMPLSRIAARIAAVNRETAPAPVGAFGHISDIPNI